MPDDYGNSRSEGSYADGVLPREPEERLVEPVLRVDGEVPRKPFWADHQEKPHGIALRVPREHLEVAHIKRREPPHARAVFLALPGVVEEVDQKARGCEQGILAWRYEKRHYRY